jgi:hypothetical protein
MLYSRQFAVFASLAASLGLLAGRLGWGEMARVAQHLAYSIPEAPALQQRHLDPDGGHEGVQCKRAAVKRHGLLKISLPAAAIPSESKDLATNLLLLFGRGSKLGE